MMKREAREERLRKRGGGLRRGLSRRLSLPLSPSPTSYHVLEHQKERVPLPDDLAQGDDAGGCARDGPERAQRAHLPQCDRLCPGGEGRAKTLDRDQGARGAVDGAPDGAVRAVAGLAEDAVTGRGV